MSGDKYSIMNSRIAAPLRANIPRHRRRVACKTVVVGALAGVDLKLARARYHLVDLTDKVEHAVATSGYALTAGVEGKPPAWVYRVSGLPVVAPDWSTIVGDILTNLRAALDHLAWQLVLLASIIR